MDDRRRAAPRRAPARLRDLVNLGARSEEQLHAVGITTPEQLESVGPEEAYRRLRRRFGARVTSVYLYALESALLDVVFTDLAPEHRDDLRDTAQRINAELDAEQPSD